jgi:transglutaminase-like putative cysteine protease
MTTLTKRNKLLSLSMRNLIRVTLGVLLITLWSCNLKTGETTIQTNKTAQPVKKVSIKEIEAGIKSYIQKKTEESNGYFYLTDREKEFKMKLVRVHTEYLANLGPKKHFACVDLADITGDVYDVDFFLNGEPGEMEVTETSVHKLNGKPYYAWKQRADKTWYRMPVEGASTRLLGVIEGSDAFDFEYRVQLPEIVGHARMWIPIATTDQFQTVEIVSMQVAGKYEMIKEEKHGNTILYVEMNSEQSKEILEIIYRVKRIEKGAIEEAGPVHAKHLEDNVMMPVGGRFTEIASNAMRGRDAGDLMRARALYDYIIDNMRYMKYGNYGKGDSNYACDVRTGNCSEFHSFFISLARSAGIPARFAVGAAVPSERNEGGIDGYHCWAEFYAEGKWWPIDISEANKYTALATYYFGHHPANRIELSRGRDIEINPSPASGPINFHAFPLLEINGKPAETKTTFSYYRPGKPAS